MAHAAALTRARVRAVAFALGVLAPALAAACPNCVGTAKPADARLWLAAMIVLPLIAATVVFIVIRRAVRQLVPPRTPPPEKASGATVASDGSGTGI